MYENMMTPTYAYDKRMLHVNADSPYGDRVNVQLPVEAAKKLIRSIGKMPVTVKGMDDPELAELMDAVAECLDEERIGDIISVDRKDGTRIRIFVE